VHQTKIQDSTRAYESWLARRMPLLPKDIQAKHERMAENAFPFLRATFYRWAQLWPDLCPHSAAAPRVLGVGDLHIENFGTWRDSEGRLVWGINDFDEACRLPYTNDLVRLAASALLTSAGASLSCTASQACDVVLEGYTHAMREGGRPFLLAEDHRWLRSLAMNDLRDPTRFWERLNALPTITNPLPPEVKRALTEAMPERGLVFRVVHRRAGLGSLGRRRYTALASWHGAMIARETKELTETAWTWMAAGKKIRKAGPLYYQDIMKRAVRAHDPFVYMRGRWLVRRLAPDCSRVELASLPRAEDELALLRAMGQETANVHLGAKSARSDILKDLRKRPRHWLRKAAKTMADATIADWKHWRQK
jgi:hypothetical protein